MKAPEFDVWVMDGGIVRLFYACKCEATGKNLVPCPKHDTRNVEEYCERWKKVVADVETAQKQQNEKAQRDDFMRKLLGEEEPEAE